MSKVLLLDDERGIRETLSLILKNEGFSVECAENAYEGLSLIDDGNNYDFIICDIRLPGLDGMEFLREVRNRDLSSIVIMISAYGSVETSVKAVKYGADDYINKPINPDELILRMRMAEERRRLKRENLYLRKKIGKAEGFEEIVFVSEAMGRVVDMAKKISQYKTTVLLTGESGTGKELIARAIHSNSPRRDGAFVAVNCAAIPGSLIESELFGYVKGAFSGATYTKRGLFEEAHGGTLFLDEVGEISPGLQTKLLRAIQEEEIRRLGNTKPIKVDVRIIAATSRDLKKDIECGRFRADLFYRLNAFPIHIPPLRERKEDIPCLVEYFIKKYNEKLNRHIRGVSVEVMDKLFSYPWHGNVRELQNVIERAVILSDSDIIDTVDLGTPKEGYSKVEDPVLDSFSLEDAWHRLERVLIEKALLKARGNRTKAAELLGISRRSLLYKLKRYGYTGEKIKG
ncbi:Transcriptional regulatory protein ZraR [bacterium HR37]|nr:Transcriptional regulatory protein ZraR [bacterium HR37]